MTDLGLIFNLAGNAWTLQCKDTDDIGNVFNKFCFKAQLDPNSVKFYFNSYEILKNCGKSVRALGLTNSKAIDVVLAKNIVGA